MYNNPPIPAHLTVLLLYHEYSKMSQKKMFTDNKEYKTWAYYSLHGVGVFETFPLLQNAITKNKGQGFSNCYKGFEGLDEAIIFSTIKDPKAALEYGKANCGKQSKDSKAKKGNGKSNKKAVTTGAVYVASTIEKKTKADSESGFETSSIDSDDSNFSLLNGESEDLVNGSSDEDDPHCNDYVVWDPHKKAKSTLTKEEREKFPAVAAESDAYYKNRNKKILAGKLVRKEERRLHRLQKEKLKNKPLLENSSSVPAPPTKKKGSARTKTIDANSKRNAPDPQFLGISGEQSRTRAVAADFFTSGSAEFKTKKTNKKTKKVKNTASRLELCLEVEKDVEEISNLGSSHNYEVQQDHSISSPDSPPLSLSVPPGLVGWSEDDDVNLLASVLAQTSRATTRLSTAEAKERILKNETGSANSNALVQVLVQKAKASTRSLIAQTLLQIQSSANNNGPREQVGYGEIANTYKILEEQLQQNLWFTIDEVRSLLRHDTVKEKVRADRATRTLAAFRKAAEAKEKQTCQLCDDPLLPSPLTCDTCRDSLNESFSAKHAFDSGKGEE